MSQIKTIITNGREYDARSFIELWYSSGQIGQRMLIANLSKKGTTKATVYKWVRGERVPQAKNMDNLRKAIKEVYGIRTLSFVLFPNKQRIAELLERFAPKKETWDGKPDWEALREKMEGKSEAENESKE